MDYAISIRLTEKQYHVLKNMAHAEYRTMGNMVGALIAEGTHFYLADHCVAVRKIEKDCVTDHPKCEYYKDEEVIETLTGIPLIQ
jgi:hypothetical protein